MDLPTIVFINRSRPGRLGIFVDKFPDRNNEQMLVCFHDETFARQMFDTPEMQKQLASFNLPGPWEVERLSVREWVSCVTNLWANGHIARIAFLRDTSVLEERTTLAEYAGVDLFIITDHPSPAEYKLYKAQPEKFWEAQVEKATLGLGRYQKAVHG